MSPIYQIHNAPHRHICEVAIAQGINTNLSKKQKNQQKNIAALVKKDQRLLHKSNMPPPRKIVRWPHLKYFSENSGTHINGVEIYKTLQHLNYQEVDKVQIYKT